MTRPRYRGFIVDLLFAISEVNHIDRAAISDAIRGGASPSTRSTRRRRW